MKVWTITVILILLIGLTIPFVTADVKKSDGKIRTPSNVEIKPVDGLAPIKKIIGMSVDTRVDIIINGEWKAKVPDNSPILSVGITEECIKAWPYGTLQWYQCEGGR